MSACTAPYRNTGSSGQTVKAIHTLTVLDPWPSVHPPAADCSRRKTQRRAGRNLPTPVGARATTPDGLSSRSSSATRSSTGFGPRRARQQLLELPVQEKIAAVSPYTSRRCARTGCCMAHAGPMCRGAKDLNVVDPLNWLRRTRIPGPPPTGQNAEGGRRDGGHALRRPAETR